MRGDMINPLTKQVKKASGKSCRPCESAPARRCWRYSLARHEGGTDQRHSQRRKENPLNIAFVGNSVDQRGGIRTPGLSGRHCDHQLGEPYNIEDAPEIIGKRGQAEFGTFSEPRIRNAPWFIHCLIEPNGCSTASRRRLRSSGRFANRVCIRFNTASFWRRSRANV